MNISFFHSKLTEVLQRSNWQHIINGSGNGLTLNSNKPVPESIRIQCTNAYINGLVQDCSNSSADALELLQFCTKPLIYATKLQCINLSGTETAIFQLNQVNVVVADALAPVSPGHQQPWY